MPVRWSVLALSLCWLLPLAHETGRKVRLPGNDFDRLRLPSLLESLLGYGGGASLGNGKGALSVAAADAADSRNEHSHATTGYRGLFRHLYRLRFPLRNQSRLTPYAKVHFRRTRGGDGVAVNSIAAATDSGR
jgi:hypothetical protein